ncbi:MAG: Aureobasidin resistance protein Aur1 [Thelocarpon superellum]|nr:MAG: Aureobasidin resistance protein Aur1 [Thelocarpon superellum]
MWRDRPQSTGSESKSLFLWPSMPVLVPHRLRRKWRSRLRSRQSPASSLTAIETSFSPADTLRALRMHRWSYYDGQYLLLLIIAVFSLSVIQTPGPIVKTLVATLLMGSLVFPITRQFFLPFLPIATWLIFFLACGFVSSDYRPPIWVRVLPALENIFYGANLSNILSAHQSVVLDVLAWLPYGIVHFAAPFLCSAVTFVFGPPGSVPVFARSFGYMNLIGVTIQMLFPCSPPWYENKFGLAPADYSMAGSPAGLARIDRLFGIDMYTSNFTASPVVFGAFPSLHAGCATIEALFLSHLFPRLRPFFVMYTIWIWWATMYLSHHYAVDLVGGSLLAGMVFYIAKAKYLPRVQQDKETRWDYDYVEIGDVSNEHSYGLAELDTEFRHSVSDSDEWTAGSSSSVSSDCMSPMEEGHSLWEGETLGSHSDSDSHDPALDAAGRDERRISPPGRR